MTDISVELRRACWYGNITPEIRTFQSGASNGLVLDAAATIAELRANQERMLCQSCGTLTRDADCDCTKNGLGVTQNLVNYADTSNEDCRKLLLENDELRAKVERLTATLTKIRDVTGTSTEAHHFARNALEQSTRDIEDWALSRHVSG